MKKIWLCTQSVTVGILIVVMSVRDLVAGDILRGNYSSSSSPSAPAGTGPGVGTTAGSPHAQDRLARTSQALQSVKAMQAAARALARQGHSQPGSDQNSSPTTPAGTNPGGGIAQDRLAQTAQAL